MLGYVTLLSHNSCNGTEEDAWKREQIEIAQWKLLGCVKEGSEPDLSCWRTCRDESYLRINNFSE